LNETLNLKIFLLRDTNIERAVAYYLLVMTKTSLFYIVYCIWCGGQGYPSLIIWWI